MSNSVTGSVTGSGTTRSLVRKSLLLIFETFRCFLIFVIFVTQFLIKILYKLNKKKILVQRRPHFYSLKGLINYKFILKLLYLKHGAQIYHIAIGRQTLDSNIRLHNTYKYIQMCHHNYPSTV